jgi:PAS domain S-box-containing protein
MRDYKDQLSLHLYEEDIAFLVDESGHILGMTQKALEISGKSRFELFGKPLIDLLDESSRSALEEDMRNARKGVFEQTILHLKSKPSGAHEMQVKVVPLRLKAGTMLLVLMREHPTEEQP